QTFVLLFHGYLLLAVFMTSSRESSWCQGVRFLLLATCFVYAVLGLFLICDQALRRSPIIKRTWETLGENPSWLLGIRLLGLLFAMLWFLVQARSKSTRLLALAGAIVFPSVAVVCSYNRTMINWSEVTRQLVLHLAVSAALAHSSAASLFFSCLSAKLSGLLDLAQTGAQFLFEHLAVGIDFANTTAAAHNLIDGVTNIGPVFAFYPLSKIFFLGFFINLLYYYWPTRNVLFLVSHCLQLLTGFTLCESMVGMANTFLGGPEAMLLVQPFLAAMTRAELFTALTLGFSTATSGIFSNFTAVGAKSEHVQNSAVMGVLGALFYSRIVFPETERVTITMSLLPFDRERSALLVASTGATQGLKVVGSLIACIISFTAIVKLLNSLAEWAGRNVGYEGTTLQ
ncbi:unnamed protein product, partial [Ixodes persulcatus]